MWLTKIFTAALAILTGLLPASCSKAKSPTVKPTAPVLSSNSLSITNKNLHELALANHNETCKNLGELALTNHYETYVDLGAGTSCTFMPNSIGHGNLQLTMSVESKNATGETKDLSVVQIVTKSGKTFEVAVGDINFTLTPKLQGEQ